MTAPKYMIAFYWAYRAELMKAVKANPGAFAYGSGDVPVMARRITMQIADGRVEELTDTMKSAAKALNIKPTMKAVRAFLASDAGRKLFSSKEYYR